MTPTTRPLSRLQTAQRALTAHPVDFTQPHNPGCTVASMIAQLVDDHDEHWRVDTDACPTCGISACVTHEGASVWMCMLCGQHGTLGGPTPSVLH